MPRRRQPYAWLFDGSSVVSNTSTVPRVETIRIPRVDGCGPFVEFTGYRPRRPKLTPVSLISTDSKRGFGILPCQTVTRLQCRGRKSRPLRRAVYKSSFWASTEAQETSHGRSAMINNNCYYARQRLNSNRTLTAWCMHSATRRVIHSFIHSFIY